MESERWMYSGRMVLHQTFTAYVVDVWFLIYPDPDLKVTYIHICCTYVPYEESEMPVARILTAAGR